jgi:hypothetical protein
MSDYKFSPGGPTKFPAIRWKQLDDGRYEAEWLVEFEPRPVIPLLARLDPSVHVELSFPSGRQMLVRLTSEFKTLRPDVYSVFYQLIRPAFDAGLIRSIEGGDLETHAFTMNGTFTGPDDPGRRK